jgi:LysM repeat protein
MDTLSKRVKLSILLIVIATVTVVCAGSGAGGNSAGSDYQGPLSATIFELSGTVQVLKAAEGVYNDASVGQELENQDQVLTHEDGRARIDLSTGTIIRLSPLSNFTFETMENTDDGVLTRLSLEVGRLWVILNGGEVEVDTPAGLASVRGSYLHVWVLPDNNETMVTCLEGECALANEYGTVTMVAGQTASITGIDLPPTSGKMSQEDVDLWLEENPEATKVLLDLTATVAASENKDKPDATKRPTSTPIVVNTKAPSITPTAVDCGPPADWITHTVTSGETMESIAKAYAISVGDLKYANCRGDSTVVVVGESLFVPNVPTITPTPTKTPLPTSTPKPTTPAATAVPTKVPAPTNSPSVFSAHIGPDGTTIVDGAPLVNVCKVKYSITVTDPDVVKEVKMIYSLDGSIPDWSTAVGAGKYKLLSGIGGGTYEAMYAIPSYDATGNLVKYRFAVKDGGGNISYWPDAGAYTFTDNANCGAPTLFTGFAVTELPIESTDSCARDYQVSVTDLNGINNVLLWYKITDQAGTPHVSSTEPLSYITGDDYGTTSFTIDSSNFTTPVTILFKFEAQDNHTNWSYSTVFSFDVNKICP